jgi:predicted nuclease of restriction endonuclease-like (RecB) superfamily
MGQDLTRYGELLTQIKDCIRRAQVKATLSANAEMILMYWDIGRMIHKRQQHEGWGAKVIPQLSRDIRNELPEIKGFSERNLKRMIAFYREYPLLSANGPQAVAQLPTCKKSENLQQLVAKIPWGHHILLMEKIKNLPARLWHMRQTIEQGWSRNVLGLMIKSNAHKRKGAAVTNFEKRLPDPQSDLARQALKDPYIFDFLTLAKPFQERELETELIKHLEKFLIELGRGFAFVGRQYHIEVGDKDFYIDLLFYHLKLRCFVVIELKKGAFKPEYAGKINFYCSVVDDRRSVSRAPIGHLAINTKPMCTNQGFKSLIPKDRIFNSYLYWVLKSSVTKLQNMGRGCTFDELSKELLASLEIPVPPLDEQRRIVARIEELTHRAEEARRILREAEEELISFTPALLAKAFRGELQP